jgi:hypothetical protein
LGDRARCGYAQVCSITSHSGDAAGFGASVPNRALAIREAAATAASGVHSGGGAAAEVAAASTTHAAAACLEYDWAADAARCAGTGESPCGQAAHCPFTQRSVSGLQHTSLQQKFCSQQVPPHATRPQQGHSLHRLLTQYGASLQHWLSVLERLPAALQRVRARLGPSAVAPVGAVGPVSQPSVATARVWRSNTDV